MAMDTVTSSGGTTALVTGGAGGIGWATACVPAAKGTDVAICSRPGKTLDEADAKIKASGLTNISCYAADVSSEADMKALFADIGQKFGHLTYLVNNAGIDSFCDLDAFSLSAFRRVLDITVASVFLAVAEGLPLLRTAKSA